MKIGLTALTLRAACVLGVFFVKKKESRLRLIVDCRKAKLCSLLRHLLNCCLEMYPRVLKSMPLVLSTRSLLACITGVPMLSTAFTGCVSLEKFAMFSGGERVSNKYLKMTEIEEMKISPHQTL